MDIMQSALSKDIKAITESNPTDSNYYWTAEIHCGSDDSVESMKVLSIDFICDYETKFADEVILRLVVGAGKYAYRIYPKLSQLEVTLYKVPINEVGAGVDDTQSSQSERYAATLLNPSNPAIEANSFNQPSEYSLDLTNLVEIDFQLICKPVEQARMRSFGGVFRNHTVEDVIKAVLTNECKQVETNTLVVPQGVEMVKANNTTPREHIVIPQGTRLVDVPGYIHQYCGGVYNAGFSCYYQKDHWYVFPPFNTANFDTNQRVATIINIPANRMPAIERTYRKDGNNLTILITGNTQIKNLSEEMILNEGSGVRFGIADQFMESFVKTTDNKAVAGRGSNNSEFTTISRENKLNNVLQGKSKITSNPYLEYSRLAARDGSLVTVSWENSNPALLYPGMPICMLSLENDQINKIYGLLIKCQHFVSGIGSGFQISRHKTTTNMMIFAKRNINLDNDS